MKEVKVLVARLCLALCNTENCSSPGSSVHVILQTRRRVSSYSLLQGIFLTQGRLHCRQFLYHMSHQGSPLGRVEQP